jgi:hypothetical protein
MSKNSSKNAPGGPFRFRVSDSLNVPLRGHLLRLRLLEGRPAMKDLGPGKRIRLNAPAGGGRDVEILGHSATGGRATQERLETIRELDLVIRTEDAGDGSERVEIGWQVTGPVA